MQLGDLRSDVSSPNRVWGRALAEIEFGAFYPYNMAFGGSNFIIFPFFYLHRREVPLRREAQGVGLARLPQRPVLPLPRVAGNNVHASSRIACWRTATYNVPRLLYLLYSGACTNVKSRTMLIAWLQDELSDVVCGARQTVNSNGVFYHLTNSEAVTHKLHLYSDRIYHTITVVTLAAVRFIRSAFYTGM